MRARWTDFLVLGLLSCCALVPAGAQTASQVRQAAEGAARGAAAELGLGIDPKVAEQMAASALTFAGNFCSPVNQVCDQTLFDSRTAAAQARTYLRDLANGDASVDSFGARLARSIGQSFAAIGWPSAQDNTSGVVNIARNGERAVRASLYTPSGYVDLGSNVSRLLLEAGRHAIRLEFGSADTTNVTVSVSARERSTLWGSSTDSGPRSGRIDPSSDLFCYDRTFGMQGATDRRAVGMFNWGRARIVGDSSPYLAPIANMLAADIGVAGQVSECGSRCREGLAIAFAQAISVWRTGCLRCDPNALSLIRVGDSVWADARIASRLRSRARGNVVPLDLRTILPDEGGRTVAAPSLSVPLTTIVGYEPLSGAKTVIQQLCSTNSAEARWVAPAKYFACGGSDVSAVGNPRVVLMKDATSCGASADFVACGLPSMGIQLTLQDTAFKLSTPDGDVTIGSARAGEEPFSLADVVLHEVGHWFGVPHFEDIGLGTPLDVMASTLGDGSRCVSGTSLTLMNNALDTRWEWRVKERQGLRRPASGSPLHPPPPVAPPRYTR